jgi:hypothetical protein
MSLPTNPAVSTLQVPASGVRVKRQVRGEWRLATLGDTALDVLELDVVGVVGLDIGGETVESALDGFLGGRVHHAGLSYTYTLAFIPTSTLSLLRTGTTYVLASIIRRPTNKRNL